MNNEKPDVATSDTKKVIMVLLSMSICFICLLRFILQMRFQLCRANFAACILFQNHRNVRLYEPDYLVNESAYSVVFLRNGV